MSGRLAACFGVASGKLYAHFRLSCMQWGLRQAQPERELENCFENLSELIEQEQETRSQIRSG
ncbi:hypothetical protein BES08_08330 [Novosphingobium resinovorum]|jgi:hypothetical protein|uniref:Uncharacterized protein n=1 Tax=Novosphingobium resinovorum TaxID=158500 RepID=A0A1D8A3R3_9SPHN|nr:hypothetical protein BES08_08330 [Novosphingobium resinovorum]